jgi:hypothetical protein
MKYNIKRIIYARRVCRFYKQIGWVQKQLGSMFVYKHMLGSGSKIIIYIDAHCFNINKIESNKLCNIPLINQSW